MNFILECDVTLSKKMEKICEAGEPVSINISGIRGNKGRAVVRVTAPSGVTAEDLAGIGETSLMLKATAVSDDVSSLMDQTPQAQIFGPKKRDGSESPAIKKMAKVDSRIPEGDPHPLSATSLDRPAPRPQERPQARIIRATDRV